MKYVPCYRYTCYCLLKSNSSQLLLHFYRAMH